MKKNLVLEIAEGEITASNAASLSNKLCQMSNGAIYDDNQNIIEIHSRKLDALEDIIESMNGKPLLVAYWYKHDFERIAKRLESLVVLLPQGFSYAPRRCNSCQENRKDPAPSQAVLTLLTNSIVNSTRKHNAKSTTNVNAELM